MATTTSVVSSGRILGLGEIAFTSSLSLSLSLLMPSVRRIMARRPCFPLADDLLAASHGAPPCRSTVPAASFPLSPFLLI